MTLMEMRYVCEIVNSKSFTKAAQKLYVSQPALSKSVQKLEKDLGVVIFVRRQHQAVLTEEGQKFVNTAREILRLVQETEEYFQEMKKEKGKVVSLGITPFYSHFYLPMILQAIKEKLPEMELKIIEESTEDLAKLLRERILDMAMIVEDHSPTLSFETLKKEKILLAVPPCHPLAEQGQNRKINLKALKDKEFISVKKYEEFVRPLFEQAGYKPKVVVESMNWETVEAMVAKNLGIALLPEVLKYFKQSEKPVYMELDSGIAYRTYSLAVLKEVKLSQLTQQVMTIIKELFNKNADGLNLAE